MARDLGHRDRGLDPGVDADLFEEVLEGEAVHDRAEHPHVVGAGAVHALLLELGAAEEVAAADDAGDFDALPHRLRDLVRDPGDHLGGNAEATTTEDFAGQFEEDAAGSVRRRGLVRVGSIGHD